MCDCTVLYNNVTSVCIFIGCWLVRDILKDKHTQVVSNPCQKTCFSLFMPPKSFNKPFEFLLYKTNILHLSVHVYCNWSITVLNCNRSQSQTTSQLVKNNSHATRLGHSAQRTKSTTWDEVEWRAKQCLKTLTILTAFQSTIPKKQNCAICRNSWTA